MQASAEVSSAAPQGVQGIVGVEGSAPPAPCHAMKSDHLCVFVAEVIALPENVAPHRSSRSSQQEADAAAYYVVADPTHVRLSRLLVYSSQPVHSVEQQAAGQQHQAEARGGATRHNGQRHRATRAPAVAPSGGVPAADQAARQAGALLRAGGPSVAEHARMLALVVAAAIGMLLALALFTGGPQARQ